MMKKICWLFDAIALLGATLFLIGLYLVWGLVAVLVISGLSLIAWALRMSYLYGNSE